MELYEKNVFIRLGKISQQNFLINGRQCFEINEIGLFIWECFSLPSSIEDVQKKVLDCYEGKGKKNIEKDVRNFVDLLIKYELINKVE